jgi:hypothetical protein
MPAGNEEQMLTPFKEKNRGIGQCLVAQERLHPDSRQENRLDPHSLLNPALGRHNDSCRPRLTIAETVRNRVRRKDGRSGNHGTYSASLRR